MLTASLGAYLLTEKFCYHQPFWRQEWKLRATNGLEISRNLMCHWHNHLADQLLPIYNLIAANMRESDYLKVDETPIKYLDPGTGKTSTGQFWVYHHAQHGVLYDWHTSRANTCLDRVLLGGSDAIPFKGYLQSDGLRAYTTFINRQPDYQITPVSCLAHIRRKFIEARGDHPKLAAWILYLIGKIYAIENNLRESQASPEERKQTREEKTRRPYDHLKKLAEHLKNRSSNHTRQPVGKSAELRPCPTAPPRTLLRRRPDRVRQQPDRKRSPADKARHEKLDVHRRSRHRLAQRRDLHDGRASQTPRPRPVRLPQVVVRAPARDDQPGQLRPAAPKQLDRGAESAARKSSIDGRNAIALAKMLERLR